MEILVVIIVVIMLVCFLMKGEPDERKLNKDESIFLSEGMNDEMKLKKEVHNPEAVEVAEKMTSLSVSLLLIGNTGYAGVDSLSDSADIDYLHFVLYLSSLAGGVSENGTKYIDTVFGFDKSSTYWNEYIKNNGINGNSYRETIPLTLNALEDLESHYYDEIVNQYRWCARFIDNMEIVGNGLIKIEGGNNQKQIDGCKEYISILKSYHYEGRLLNKSELEKEFLEKQSKNESNRMVISNANAAPLYMVCPFCSEAIESTFVRCPECQKELSEVQLNRGSYLFSVYEKKYYRIGSFEDYLKLLFEKATSGYLLKPVGIKEGAYYKTNFLVRNGDYLFSNKEKLYRIGPYLYDPENMFKGSINFDSCFDAVCTWPASRPEGLEIVKYVFYKDGSVQCYHKTLEYVGNYKRYGNIIVLDMLHKKTGEKSVIVYGIIRQRLCMAVYVDEERNKKIIEAIDAQAEVLF